MPDRFDLFPRWEPNNSLKAWATILVVVPVVLLGLYIVLSAFS